MEGRRLGYVRITGELVQEMFLTTHRPDQWYQVGGGIPADAKFIRMSIDESQGRSDLLLVYEHESFPLVRNYPGWEIPALPSPQFSSVHVTAEEVQEMAIAKLRGQWPRSDTPIIVEE